jgi:hypothetical protein
LEEEWDAEKGHDFGGDGVIKHIDLPYQQVLKMVLQLNWVEEIIFQPIYIYRSMLKRNYDFILPYLAINRKEN